MDFWLAVVLIVIIGAVSEMYRAKLKSGAEKSRKMFEELQERMAKLEGRTANIESIILERENQQKFDV